MIQKTFRSELLNRVIINLQDCNLVVMVGAGLIGQNPLTISARIFRFSYSIAVHDEFDSKIDQKENLYLFIVKCNIDAQWTDPLPEICSCVSFVC